MNAETRRDQTHTPTLDRRVLLKGAGLGAAALLASPADALAVQPRRSFRVAHLTDIHVQPERRGGEGFAACLRRLATLSPKPDLILTGGDLVMDSFEQNQKRTTQVWDLFSKTLADECKTPVRHCLGNHDIWGWDKTKSGTTGSEPGWGKRWAIDQLGIPGSYYAFEAGGWKFIVLDSVQPTDPPGGYVGGIDQPQFDWLKDQLQRTPSTMPVLVLSHIPILAGAAMLFDAGFTTSGIGLTKGAVIQNSDKLVRLFESFPNMRLCLSGHVHEVERLDFQGITYLCNGAVCGAWWEGKLKNAKNRDAKAKPTDPQRPMRCDEGFGLIDLFPDGTFIHQYATYGWQAEA